MSDEIFKQCMLHKGDSHQMTWLPKKFAVEGGYVEIKDEKGVWDNGWLVHKVYAPTRTLTEVRERSRDYLETRRASDV